MKLDYLKYNKIGDKLVAAFSVDKLSINFLIFYHVSTKGDMYIFLNSVLLVNDKKDLN